MIRTLTILIVSLFTCSQGITQNCNCKGLVDWNYHDPILLFEIKDGTIIDTLTNDSANENSLVFNIIEDENEYFKVEIGLSQDTVWKKGWIKKADYLGTYARNYSIDKLTLYSKPNLKSKPKSIIKEYYEGLYEIMKCNDEWVEVKVTINGKEYSGWLERKMQCPNPYTTCN